MKTNKLPQSEWSDLQESGSQSQQSNQSRSHYLNNDNVGQAGYASNDDSYCYDILNDDYSNHLAKDTSSQDSYFGYKSADKSLIKAYESAMIDSYDVENDEPKHSDTEDFNIVNGYHPQHSENLSVEQPTATSSSESEVDTLIDTKSRNLSLDSTTSAPMTTDTYNEIPERIFMNGLIKHTGIALAIIIPLAAFSAYAATPPVNTVSSAKDTTKVTANATTDKTTTETLSVKPSAIIHNKSANTPTTVDSVDLKKYAGTWYEIGRLPMYFQRNCASDVTATYTEKTDGSGIIVTNKCADKDGADIIADGLAKPVDDTGSKLKVTFLPSWIRWLPVGRADYWVLARDADYKTALVGTPDKDYLWLLARSPNVSQETYAKYRQIAQQQGYDLKEFKLTPQTNQTVSLVP